MALQIFRNVIDGSDLKTSETVGLHSLAGSYSSIGCCDTGVDPATLLALIAGMKSFDKPYFTS